MKMVAHVDFDEEKKVFVVAADQPSDMAVAFRLLGEGLLRMPGVFIGRRLKLARELLEDLVPADSMPTVSIVDKKARRG